MRNGITSSSCKTGSGGTTSFFFEHPANTPNNTTQANKYLILLTINRLRENNILGTNLLPRFAVVLVHGFHGYFISDFTQFRIVVLENKPHPRLDDCFFCLLQ
ncbi:hypothetical protein D3C87_1913460 [compost metagenome]